jgi:hypothetical protein
VTLSAQRLLRIAIAVAAIGLLAGGAPAAPTADAPVFAVVADDTGRTPLRRLVRLAPLTLDPLPGSVELGRRLSSGTWLVASPTDSRVAVIQPDAVSIIDSQRMVLLGKLRSGPEASLPYLHGPWSWPRPDRLVGPGLDSVVVVDPGAPRVVEHRRWPGATLLALRRTSSGVAVVRDQGRGSPLVFEEVGPEKPFTTWRLQRIRSGIEDVHVRAGLPPVARRAVTQARSLVARRRGVRVHRVRAVAVSPAQWTWAEPCARGPWARAGIPEQDFGYEVVLSVGRRRLYAHVGPDVVFCGPFPVAERPLARTNLLAARSDTSHVTEVAVAADRPSARLFALTPDGRVASLDPGGSRSLSALKGWVPPRFPEELGIAHALGEASIALETATHIKLLNARTGRVRVLDPRPCGLTTAPGLALVHSSPHAASCTGVRAYGRDGMLRFAALPALRILSVDLVGRYAYARPGPIDTGLAEIYVIELATGRVVNQVRPSRPLFLLRP